MTSSPICDCSSKERALSSWRQPLRLAACSLALIGYGAAFLATPATALSVDKMLNATPLVLKDGRIAEVSVHTIPFPDDAVAPASKIRKALDSFTQSIATDCFLTAQVIGHVDKKEISGRETADIHRLARARADTIQTSLVDNGLPAASIASVWDWRFMVQEPRVTLWVFRLTAGDDCEDAPLSRQADDQIAAVTTTEPSPQQTSSKAAAASVKAQPKNPSPAEVPQKVIPAAKPKSKELTAPIPAVPSALSAGAVNDDGVKGASAKQARKTPDTQVASIAPSEEIDKKGFAGIVDKGALEIIFATNSSYFPEGAGDQLRAFMRTLDKSKSYVLRIQTSVDGNASVSGASSNDEAQRYNTWLAERRFKRVEAWLLKNGDGRNITLEPSLVENDGSRRVRIEPNPLG
ncbi:MAG: hypothetical protein AAGA21_13330 [Pseudomonadota bacterium]